MAITMNLVKGNIDDICNCFQAQCWQDYFNSCCNCCCICQYSRAFSSAFKGKCCCDENNPHAGDIPRTGMLARNWRRKKIRIKLLFKP